MRDSKEIIMTALNKARNAYLGLVKEGKAGIEKCIGAFGDTSTMGDLVTEEVIINSISSELRDVSFVTEERGIIGDIKNTRYRVLIDPIDGSTNMKRGIRFFSSGIALFEGINYSDIVAAGVIDIPNGQIYFANRTNIHIDNDVSSPSDVNRLDKAIVSLDFRPLKKEKEFIEPFLKLCQKIRYVRNFGSSLLDICQIVTGKIDAFVCLTPELRLFDLVPALFILERVGGCWVIDKPGFILTEPMIKERYAVIAASNNQLLEEIINFTSINWNNKSD
ncbi:MAG: inositol monophosphatase family protein [Nitrososphaerota archaeon]